MFHAGETVEVTYERDGKRYTAELTPLYDEELGRYRYGFVGGEVEKGNVFKNLLYSGYEVKYWIDTTFGSLKMLATGGVTLNDMSGPVGLVDAILRLLCGIFTNALYLYSDLGKPWCYEPAAASGIGRWTTGVSDR